MRICIVIPAYGPGEKLIAYVRDLCAAQLGPIVAVDDGSGARYTHIFDALFAIASYRVQLRRVFRKREAPEPAQGAAP